MNILKEDLNLKILNLWKVGLIPDGHSHLNVGMRYLKTNLYILDV